MKFCSLLLLIILISCDQERNQATQNRGTSKDSDTSKIVISDSVKRIDSNLTHQNQVSKSDITHDSAFVSGSIPNTDVYLMYSSYSDRGDSIIVTQDSDDPRVDFGESLFFAFDSYLTKNNSKILIANKLEIGYDSAMVYKKKKYIKEQQVLTEFVLSKMQRSTPNISKIGRFKLNFEQPTVYCDDTYRNKISIATDLGSILFKNLLNVKMYEADLNQDGKNEIYIFSFLSCSSQIRIYQVV